MTRTEHRWKEIPGNMDKLNTFNFFETDNEYGIPLVKKQKVKPEWLVPFGQRIRTEKELRKGCYHFFLDDYRFEHVWNRPYDTLSVIEKVGNTLTPDFSLYTNYPLAMQIWNTYRNRWLGAFWQSLDINVIPTICWSDEKSYDFCFKGVEKGSTVAISIVSSKKAGSAFVNGFIEMLNEIEPKLILCYGESCPFNLEKYLIDDQKITYYPSYWKSIRDAMKKKGGK